jgi:hypothetical protein
MHIATFLEEKKYSFLGNILFYPYNQHIPTATQLTQHNKRSYIHLFIHIHILALTYSDGIWWHVTSNTKRTKDNPATWQYADPRDAAMIQ